MSKWRKSILWALMGLVAILSAAIVWVGALFYLPFRQDWAMDNIVAIVALDWRDFGRMKAEERFLFELEQQGLPGSMESFCHLREEPELRIVQCEWQETVVLPFVGTEVPLLFKSTSMIEAGGELIRR